MGKICVCYLCYLCRHGRVAVAGGPGEMCTAMSLRRSGVKSSKSRREPVLFSASRSGPTGALFSRVELHTGCSNPPPVFDNLRVRRSTLTLVREGSGLTLVGERAMAQWGRVNAGPSRP